MAGDGVSHSPGPDELGVLVGSGGGEPERLVMLGKPAAGRVHLREWSTHNWSGLPTERDAAVADVLAQFQRDYDARRRMSAGLAQIRAWLDGRPV